MNSEKKGINTICTHTGEVEDTQYRGAISPLFMATSYQYDGMDEKRYPRSFNSPNQVALGKKIAALEKCEAGMIFGSGMAAISHCLLAFLKQGDHIILPETLYGGTYNFVVKELPKFGIEFSFAKGFSEIDFTSEIKKNTKIIYIETPSNPLMKITDLEMIGRIAKQHNLLSIIDNTFASPINQTPADFGIDIIIHSATKYMGGHSDISAGAIACSQEHKDKIWETSINMGGHLSDYTVWLLERSLKTMALRVKAQSKNAKKMAKWLEQHQLVSKVYYPGLKSHPDHALAKKQMKRYTGMLSFELLPELDAIEFMRALKLVKYSMSLAGIESTILSPAETSHFLLTKEERKKQGISDGLLRFSVGIEETNDLIFDFEQAFQLVTKKQLV
ncbi:trans-sulfuration enzyme family protein [Cochleicola gelatinilyticus]|uniref:Cystathionine beta-lyase n=1 Tax=Cochleicola gelatinilyticus TaxID=1763537 RepID=A0A167HI53_9FLAO|nr:PLP-dependent aspartate aminotransferase family protein [Cochleicola gelatinilyticus]OAB78633.1 cystathionine beta-lyase [Cochleicola gelatinilyticus]